ncbi:hypothetical protein V6Z11_A08G008100 [Gossypium hirsutum]|uniref:Zinc finger CCCH domain-containing protein 66 n=1 Tax=Gossypium hirsutum TaxID=3635 RepID=A0A1U8M184_GOSHI|nr:zinc finger CCCH domain-containing protein 66 [Gossypium hirsutum]
MCSVAMGKSTQTGGATQKFSDLLELSASNDLISFRIAIEEEGHDIDEPSLWYGRRIGTKKMGFEERTPLLIASIFGCKDVVNYIIKSGQVDVNRACGSDGARALHCAAAGGSSGSPEIVKILLNACVDINSVDANGNRPGDLIAPASCNSDCSSRKKLLEALLKSNVDGGEGFPFRVGNEMDVSEVQVDSIHRVWKDGNEKKEYPYDLTLPDIKNGMYGTDEFRMYTFKIQPCSRAYSHDWTECPFVHPGENARRRDPRKYVYSCVPCPEYRKGSCKQGDNCEYAHGIFESWLHPAQYRTRLCKDETNCNRRVCFFAHKPEELRPLYASTGSALPSPRSYSGSGLEFGSMSPLAPASPSVIKPSTSTPPLTPTGTSSIGGSMWPNQSSIVPPTLQLPFSRLKAARTARGKDLNMDKLSLETHRRFQQQQQQLEQSPTSWNNPLSGELNRFGGVKSTSLDDIFGSLDSTKPQLQGLSLKAASPQLQSPTAVPKWQNRNQQLRASYPTNLASSPIMMSPTFGVETSGPTAASSLSSKRSPSVIERPAGNRNSGFSTPASPVGAMPPNLSDWGSVDGKLDWGIQGEELKKLRKSASLVFLNNSSNLPNTARSLPSTSEEPEASRVQPHMNGSTHSAGQVRPEDQKQQKCHNTGNSDMLSAWMEQLYKDQDQILN